MTPIRAGTSAFALILAVLVAASPAIAQSSGGGGGGAGGGSSGGSSGAAGSSGSAGAAGATGAPSSRSASPSGTAPSGTPSATPGPDTGVNAVPGTRGPADSDNVQRKLDDNRARSQGAGAPSGTTANARTEGAAGGGGPSSRKTDGVADSFAQCMEAWDPGTHLTKQRFAEICRRTLPQRPDID